MSYYLDTRLEPEEATRRYSHCDQFGRPVGATGGEFYAFAIRHTGRPGWVFRFHRVDAHMAHKTLASLNYGVHAARAA